MLDLGASGEVGEVDADPRRRSPRRSRSTSPRPAPTGVRGLTPAATATADGPDLEIALDEPATGRFVTVWLTSLPAVEGGFRGEVAEVEVLGTPAT